MRKLVEEHVEDILLKKKKRKKMAKLLGLCAMVVALAVGFRLMMPGVAMTDDAICGIPEHVHSAECQSKTLICTQEEGPEHTHGEECYEVMQCDQPEHIHDQSCYPAPQEPQAPEGVVGDEGTATTPEDVENEAETTEPQEVSLSYLVESDGVMIHLYAKPGVLPNDAELHVEKVEIQKEEAIQEAFKEEGDAVAKTYTYDIKIFSKSVGGYVQPQDGTVEVKFSQVQEGEQEDTELSVYHVEMNDQNQVQNLEQVARPVSERTSEISFDAEHFSYYTLLVASVQGSIVVNGDLPDQLSGKYRVKVSFEKWDNGWKEQRKLYSTEKLTNGKTLLVKLDDQTSQFNDYTQLNAVLVDDNDKVVVKSGCFVLDEKLYDMKLESNKDSKVIGIEVTEICDLRAGSSSEVMQKLGFTINFGVFANTMEMANHLESNIAVNHLTGGGTGEVGSSGNVRNYTNLVVQVTKTVIPAEEKEFQFILCDGSGNKVKGPMTIKTNSEGVGIGTFEGISNASGSYTVYEIDERNQKIPYQNGKYGEYKVTYTNGTTDYIYAPGGNTNWIKKADQSYKGWSGSGDYLYTTDNVYPNDFDRSRVIHLTEKEFEANMPISSMLEGELTDLSRNLMGMHSSDGIDVYHVPVKESNGTMTLGEGNLKLDYHEGNMAVVNVMIPKKYQSLQLSGREFLSLKSSNGQVYQVLSNNINQNWQSKIASKLIWNFVYEDGIPYDGTFTFDAGVGMFLCPQGNLAWATTSPLTMIAQKVTQISGEIHKVPFGDPTEQKAYVSVENRKEGTSEVFTQLDLSKKWEGVADTTSLPDKISVKLMQVKKPKSGESEIRQYGEYEIKRQDEWKLEVKNLPKVDQQGNTYTYYVEEIPVDGFYSSCDHGSKETAVAGGQIIISNTAVQNEDEPSNGPLKIEKIWKDQKDQKIDEKLLPDKVEFVLYQKKEKLDTVDVQVNVESGLGSQKPQYPKGTQLILTGEAAKTGMPTVTYDNQTYDMKKEGDKYQVTVPVSKAMEVRVTGIAKLSVKAIYPVMDVRADEFENGEQVQRDPIRLGPLEKWTYQEDLPSVIKENDKFYHLTYYVVETDGRNYNATYEKSEDKNCIMVTNMIEVYGLPEAGGIGTIPFTVAGFMMVAVSLYGLFYYRNKKNGR